MDFYEIKEYETIKKSEISELIRIERIQADADMEFIISSKLYEKKDYKAAFRWAEKSATNGSPDGKAQLGLYLVLGKGCDEDFDKGMKLLHEAEAMGSVIALYNLGICLCNFSLDKMEGYKYFKKAAEQGLPEAQYMMGLWYEVPHSYDDAAVWFKAAANSGHAAAQYELGIFYLYGMGVSRDRKEAERWIKKAAAEKNWDARNYLLCC